MTFGPTEPSITGSSIDLPVALSVSVIVPFDARRHSCCCRPSMHLDRYARRRLPDLRGE